MKIGKEEEPRHTPEPVAPDHVPDQMPERAPEPQKPIPVPSK